MNGRARIGLLFALVLSPVAGNTQPWEFEKPLDVIQNHGPGIFHHLESSGRRNIAVSGDIVAVVWEDDHDGTPRIYLAKKRFDAETFEPPIRISGKGESFEPSIVALSGERFVVAWEEYPTVNARVVSADRLGPVAMLRDMDSSQANVSANGDRIFLLRADREGKFSRIRLHEFLVQSANVLISNKDCAVDGEPPLEDQLYPSSALAGDELVVVWEDRRPGHTIILASASRLNDICTFASPVRVSEPGPKAKSGYGKGHGVSRAALGSFGEASVLAVWADKRQYWEGYDIYAADYLGNSQFGPNSKVQDEFGDFARQWHAAVAGDGAGRLVVAWDDEREENSDVMLSWREGDEWSEDLALPGASGDGEQTHPTIAIDDDGNLHAAWIDRQETGGQTRLRYLFGKTMSD